MTQKPKIASFETEGLGTIWMFELIGVSGRFPTLLKNMLISTIQQFDDDYSRFKPDSFVGKLNATGSIQDPPSELIDMLDFAHRMYDTSDETFDISIGAALQSSGYGRTHKQASHRSGFWDDMIYDSSRVILPRDTAIDFGGFGKGWLLDKLAVLIEQSGQQFYVINGGGDIVFAADKPITLGLEHPYNSDELIGTTHSKRGALAVSSIIKRRWSHDQKTMHHIFDPKTSSPTANKVVSTYVRGQTGLITDTLATILLIRPDLQSALEKKFGVKSIIIYEDQLGNANQAE